MPENYPEQPEHLPSRDKEAGKAKTVDQIADIVFKKIDNLPISQENKANLRKKASAIIKQWHQALNGLKAKEKTETENFYIKILRSFEKTIVEAFNTNRRTNLTFEEAKTCIEKMIPTLQYLIDRSNHHKLGGLIRMAEDGEVPAVTEVTYSWDEMLGKANYRGSGDSKNCCAFAASTFLGLKKKIGSAWKLTAAVIRGNLEKTGNPGICLGFENYKPGTLLVWKTIKPKTAAHRPFSHVGVVRFNKDLKIYDKDGKYIGSEPFIGIVEDGDHLEGNIIPVNPNSQSWQILAESLKTAGPGRSACIEANPELDDILIERKYVQVRPNKDWYGDGSKSSKGYIAFGISTEALAKTLSPNPPSSS